MHKSATKCNETLGKWCKNKHGASKIIDTFETYQGLDLVGCGRLRRVCAHVGYVLLAMQHLGINHLYGVQVLGVFLHQRFKVVCSLSSCFSPPTLVTRLECSTYPEVVYDNRSHESTSDGCVGTALVQCAPTSLSALHRHS
jgi:hypothetical protein